MKPNQVLKYAMDIANFMESVNNLMDDKRKAYSHAGNVLEHAPEISPRPHTTPHRTAHDPVISRHHGLHEIGLDDMGMTRVVIELSTDRSHFKIWTPYDPDFVHSLKVEVPKRSRRWDADERCWRVDAYWFGNAQRLLPEYFPDIERYYTDRAIKMCEEIAQQDLDEEKLRADQEREDREEERVKRPRRKNKNRRARGDSGTKRKSRKKKRQEDTDDEYDQYTSPDAVNRHYTTLGVLKDAPEEVVKAAHKTLSRKYHPDLGGSEKQMKKINEAFEAIKEHRGWTTA